MQHFQEATPIRHAFEGRDFSAGINAANIDSRFVAGRDYALDEIDQLLPLIGVGVNPSAMRDIMHYGYAMDSIQSPITTPSIETPIQFLQNFLPGTIEVVTAARKIDELVGRATIGSWEDEQIVQQITELTGGPLPYGDTTNTPLASWNQNFVFRNVIRFELGMQVGAMEEARSARTRQSSDANKRRSVSEQLEITRNMIGFYGYNNGANLTYGLLNDPNLPAYDTLPNGDWANPSTTFLDIQQDLLTAFQELRTQSEGRIVPNRDPITLGIATSRVDYLAKTSDFGISVWDWLKQFYSNVRVVDAVQFDNANSSQNVFYIYADAVADSGSDDQRTFIQVVPATLQLLGVQKEVKSYKESYTNATAGTFCKRPYAVRRYTNI